MVVVMVVINIVIVVVIIIIIIIIIIIMLRNTVPMKNGQMQVIIHNYYTKELKKSEIMKMTGTVILILKENMEGCPQHFYGTMSEGLLVQRRHTVMLWTTV